MLLWRKILDLSKPILCEHAARIEFRKKCYTCNKQRSNRYLFLGLNSWVRLHNYMERGPFCKGSNKLAPKFCVCQITIPTPPLMPRSSYRYIYILHIYVYIDMFRFVYIKFWSDFGQQSDSSTANEVLYGVLSYFCFLSGLAGCCSPYRPSWCGKQVRLHTQDACGSRALSFLFFELWDCSVGGWSMTQLIPNMSLVRNPSLTSGQL